MAEDTDVLSLAEAKAALRDSGNSNDATLPGVITAISLALDEGCGPIVQRAATSEVYDGGGSTITLAQRPISEVSSIVEYDGTTATTLTAETNASKPTSAFLLEPYRSGQTTGLYDGRITRRSAGATIPFAPGVGNVVVTYTAGRFADTDGVSQMFKEAARLTLMHVWRSRQQGVMSVVAATTAGSGSGYEVPRTNFPAWFVPNAAKELLGSEWQGSPDGAGGGPILLDV